MKSRLFSDSHFEKIQPDGLLYLIRKYDTDFKSKQLDFYGISLIFDCEKSLKKFKDQLNSSHGRQISALYEYRSDFSFLKNNGDCFCEIKLINNTPIYTLANQSEICIEGELIYQELIKTIQLKDIFILDYDGNKGKFFNPQNLKINDDNFADAPDYMNCPISLGLMNDPITLSSGITYDRWSLIDLFCHQKSKEILCPITNNIICYEELSFKTNVIIKNLIFDYIEKKSMSKSNSDVEQDNATHFQPKY